MQRDLGNKRDGLDKKRKIEPSKMARGAVRALLIWVNPFNDFNYWLKEEFLKRGSPRPNGPSPWALIPMQEVQSDMEVYHARTVKEYVVNARKMSIRLIHFPGT